MTPGNNNTVSNKGTVYLVGAGPGDPGLLTLKGRAGIAAADVLLYDALVHEDTLVHARPDCNKIFVGKKAGSHTFTQARINAMMAQYAAAGQNVCRLKGGDPFVFGRGGEEALYLRRRGIPIVIVPGVSAAVAVPAYAGIPATHRGYSDALRIVTGHEIIKADQRGYWQHAAYEKGVLVVLMSHRNIHKICSTLIKHGMSGHTPAAAISQGTLPEQRTVCAPLGVLAQCVRQAALTTPSLLVIGETVRLREALAWFSEKNVMNDCATLAE